MTATMLLLHSIFGCGLRHVCEFGHHAVNVHRSCDDLECHRDCNEQPCHSEQRCNSHDPEGCEHRYADPDEPVVELILAASNCGCGDACSDQQGDSPCCSNLLCSFIVVNGIGFRVEAGRAASFFQNDDFWIDQSLSRSLSCVDTSSFRLGGSYSLQAMHCCWQI